MLGRDEVVCVEDLDDVGRDVVGRDDVGRDDVGRDDVGRDDGGGFLELEEPLFDFVFLDVLLLLEPLLFLELEESLFDFVEDPDPFFLLLFAVIDSTCSSVFMVLDGDSMF